ncbi:Uncharacterized protein TCM_010263 [Theobroma cacao]|uniref:Uncharacterized protein n=1 Tax=Theobroma cacao TaxID=3641 RepID=A0A061EDN1_THECC|nr:Uncharacterized protein TCM_010263 [Theobroma cacao]
MLSRKFVQNDHPSNYGMPSNSVFEPYKLASIHFHQHMLDFIPSYGYIILGSGIDPIPILWTKGRVVFLGLSDFFQPHLLK